MSLNTTPGGTFKRELIFLDLCTSLVYIIKHIESSEELFWAVEEARDKPIRYFLKQSLWAVIFTMLMNVPDWFKP